MDEIKRIAEEHQISEKYLVLYDYEYNLIQNNSSQLYNGAPVDEILRFASAGFDIALRVLDNEEISKYLSSSDVESKSKLANFIYSTLEEKLGKDYPWLKWGFHFVCNPLGLLLLEERLLLELIDNAEGRI